jgi:hypothetical protein
MTWNGVILMTIATIIISSADAKAGTPTLARDQVVQMADKFAKERGLDLDKYERPLVYYELIKKDDKWSVHYDGKSLITGDHFMIIIHDKTRKIVFYGGA